MNGLDGTSSTNGTGDTMVAQGQMVTGDRTEEDIKWELREAFRRYDNSEGDPLAHDQYLAEIFDLARESVGA